MKRLTLVVGGLLLALPCGAGVVYVDPDAPGKGDGSSWVDAFRHLQDALAAVREGDEIRAAEGVYQPDRGASQVRGDREATFRLVNAVSLRGGYAGFGHLNPDARDPKAFEALLNGDLGGDDGHDFTATEENSLHVVTSSNVESGIVGRTWNELEGFTISGGRADGEYHHDLGGGMHCRGDAVIRQCKFVANFASRGGGAYYGPSSCCVTNVRLEECIFEGNRAGEEGGGVYVGDSDVTFDRCTFQRNTAGRDGGGLMFGNDNNSLLVNCLIAGNEAGERGGAIFCTYSFDWRMMHCTISGNSAGSRGGAIFGWREACCLVRSSILWGNAPKEIEQEKSMCTLSVEFCCVQGGWTGEGTGIIDADPLFADPASNDFHLSHGSPCIDAGTSEGAPAIDIEGHGRPCSTGVDFGAYESGDCAPPPKFQRANVNGKGGIDISDPIFLLNHLFLAGKTPDCLDAADVNDDEKLDITDAVYSLSFQFMGGPAPESPFPGCGIEEWIDGLNCQSYTACQ